MITSPRRITSAALQRTVDLADREGWTDETYYNDPDCDLYQKFAKGPITVKIVWAGLGTHRKVLSVSVQSSKVLDTLSRANGLLFYDEVSGPTQLLAEALSALTRDYSVNSK
jgi:hypothetical protein